MKRPLAGPLAAALTLLSLVHPAALATARAAEPFATVVLPSQKKVSHTTAYVTMLAGAGLIGGSFVWRDRANERYDRYLEATDPAEISKLYDETTRLDHLSSGALIAGEVLIATGLYLRFVRNPSTERVGLAVTPSRCALSLRF